MTRKHINPAVLPDWSGMFTQVVVTELAGLRLIHISGQVGVHPAKELAGDGSLQAQTQQALANLQVALESAGAVVADVVKLTVYVVNYRYENAGVIREELRAFFPTDRLPALSLIGVAALAEERFLVEIDAEVVVEEGVAQLTQGGSHKV